MQNNCNRGCPIAIGSNTSINVFAEEHFMPHADKEALRRAMRVRQLMNDRLLAMTPQERDRLMQVHLAQARGT